MGNGSVVDLTDDTEEEVIRRGITKVGPRVLMHSDHTLLKYVVCDHGVKKTGLFPPDFFSAQRQIEEFLLRPQNDVRHSANAALERAGGCAVGLHLRGRKMSILNIPPEALVDMLAPAVAAAPGGLYVLGDGHNYELKKHIISHARKRGIQVVEVYNETSQKAGLTGALAENLVLSSCAMLARARRGRWTDLCRPGPWRRRGHEISTRHPRRRRDPRRERLPQSDRSVPGPGGAAATAAAGPA